MDIKHLETQYLKAKVAYYDGNPIMSDAAFDALEQELKIAGSKVIEQVGSKRKDFDFPHPTPMKSLSKIQTASIDGGTDYQSEQFADWLSKRTSLLKKEHDIDVDHMHYAPKFDGSAINIIYRGGKLESVLTRGDGQTGKDVTDRFRIHLPNSLSDDFIAQTPDTIAQIRCEAVMKKSVFDAKYAEQFANARNLVAGIIGKDEIDEEMMADITLIPLHYIVNGKHECILSVNAALKNAAILSNPQSAKIRTTIKDYVSALKFMEKGRDSFDYPLDGIVFSLPITVREILGENEHDPEWAIAVKFVPDEVVTVVEGIEWNLGKTGEMIPVIQLKPVQLAGTTVKRASGYNAGYLVKNAIGVGALVSIAKAGDIIPEVQEVKMETPETFVLPSQCPSCKSKLKYDGIHLTCDNAKCEGKIAKKLASACAMLDLKGVAGKTIEPFAKDFKSMYDLFAWVIKNKHKADLEPYGIKNDSRSHEIFVDAFLNTKSLTYAQVILMHGYDRVGLKLAEQVARDYCRAEHDYKGHEKALVEMFDDEDIRSYINGSVLYLEYLGVIVDKPETKEDGDTVYICMTGSPKKFGYTTKSKFISQFPNVEETSLTDPKCNYLVTDNLNSTSGKMKTAKKKGIEIVTYGNFKI